jgi:hypothetical protein
VNDKKIASAFSRSEIVLFINPLIIASYVFIPVPIRIAIHGVAYLFHD